ncbi:hypothetical protein ITJ54_05960 [Curtobacterium sp. VKM Ac-2865]|uniref:hypothetical protein n=1 Tax=Curtobacterium sp. VKM Ac-2865 TaxID=2783817 RepID=UPI00188BE179|nr:hypothetical protein [Curtobacterium sp. VKM Ac-2865]MBF4582211.1 hypothetical protein [Curtobacterium sp. VKM Ac-2865]
MVLVPPPARPGHTAAAVSLALLLLAVVVLAVLWAIVFGPLWLIGEERQLLLWYWVTPLSVVPWTVAVSGTVVAAVGWARSRERRAAVLTIAGALVVLLATLAMWFGGPFTGA